MTEERAPDLPYYTIWVPDRNKGATHPTRPIMVYVNGVVKVDAFVMDLHNTPDLRKSIEQAALGYLNSNGKNNYNFRRYYSSILEIVSLCQSPPSKTSSGNSESTSNDQEKASM